VDGLLDNNYSWLFPFLVIPVILFFPPHYHLSNYPRPTHWETIHYQKDGREYRWEGKMLGEQKKVSNDGRKYYSAL